ncbi:hypothetical protein COV13_02570 [Candidatus Woesearchaeota archaeon CG10_big_fil_rev_8_21_14_0_10_32_9]|nr:MAG: hypothetical protein COV13_02570 [Candidatus Woesearchaeota archaeon CG10_big_fil_rev_8_21_14_0_10_32_9]
MKKTQTKNKYNLLLILVILVLISVPILIKTTTSQKTYLSEETYYHERIIQQIRDTGKLTTDLVQEQRIPTNLFYVLFAYTYIPTNILIVIIPIIFAALSLFMLFKILKELKINEEVIRYGVIVAVISPAILYVFTVFSPKDLIYFLILTTIFLALKNNKLTVLTLILLTWSNAIIGGITLLLLVVGALLNYMKDRKQMYSNIVAYVLTLILLFVFSRVNLILDFTPTILGFGELFSEFGSLQGYTIMILGLAIIGIASWWIKTTERTTMILTISALFVISIIYPTIKLMTLTLFAIYAGFAIDYLITRVWRLEILKNITLLLIICSLIFSMVVFNTTILKTVSYDKVIGAAQLTATDKGDIILSSEKNGFIIQNLAGRKTYLDGVSYKYNEYSNKSTLSEQIYYSKNLETLEKDLQNNSIRYIFIDSEMKQNIWNNKEEGLMFFLINAKEFVKVYENNEIEIYRYLGEIHNEN